MAKFIRFLQEDGLSFEDFDIVDLETNKQLHNGKKDIGEFCLYIKDGVINKSTRSKTNTFIYMQKTDELGHQ